MPLTAIMAGVLPCIVNMSHILLCYLCVFGNALALPTAPCMQQASMNCSRPAHATNYLGLSSSQGSIMLCIAAAPAPTTYLHDEVQLVNVVLAREQGFAQQHLSQNAAH